MSNRTKAGRFLCTARGDPRRRQSADSSQMSPLQHINKPIPRRRLQLESSNQKRSHLLASNRIRRTKNSQLDRTAQGYPQIGQTLYIRQPPLPRIHIQKPRRPRRSGFRIIHSPHQPHSHHPTLDRSPRTELPRTTLGPLQNAPLPKRLHIPTVHTRTR